MSASPTALAVVLACLLLPSCATVGSAWMIGWSERAANDQIMLVSRQPATLGLHRLEYQSSVYPDLAKFLARHKWPDFLAETTSDRRHYLVLYYLARREAFAARTRRPDDRSMEFAGPYPITQREFDLLSELQRQHRQQSAPPPLR